MTQFSRRAPIPTIRSQRSALRRAAQIAALATFSCCAPHVVARVLRGPSAAPSPCAPEAANCDSRTPSPAPPSSAPGASAATYSNGPLRDIDTVIADVVRLRRLPLLRPVERRVATRAQVVEQLRSRIAEEYRPGELALEGEALRRQGLIPESMDFEQTMLDLLEEQVAGFYDPTTRSLFVSSWVPRETLNPIMAHEITHALQDQHFDLLRFVRRQRGRGDQQLAATSVTEGDATLVMLLYALGPAGFLLRGLADPDVLFARDRVSSHSTPRLAAAPRALRDSLIFPYRYGFGLCLRAYQSGGFRAVDDLLRTPPMSTEQVLHPDKLAAREPPVDIPVSIPISMQRDWIAVADDTQGELGLRLFAALAADDTTAAAAAAGWGGDRAVLLAPRPEDASPGSSREPGTPTRFALVWTIVFDPASTGPEDAEAREFELVARRAVRARYPSARVRGSSRDRWVLATAPDAAAVVARAGRTVVVLDRVPIRAITTTVDSALRQPYSASAPDPTTERP